ncbi:hypothetical protein IOD13_11590 [Brevibacterium casei]|nr:hypothetical protein [Brevibacterium casei]
MGAEAGHANARRWVRELDDMLTAAGFPRMHPIHLVLLTVAVLTVVTIVATALTGSWAIALCFGLFASWPPYRYLRHRARSKQVLRRELWPETLDHLNSGVRAGLSLPEALGSLAHRGPEPCVRSSRSSPRSTAPADPSRSRSRDSGRSPPTRSPTGSSRL